MKLKKRIKHTARFAIAATIAGFIIYVASQYIGLLNDVEASYTPLNAKKEVIAVEPEKSVREHIWTILTEAGLSFDEAMNFMAVIKCESNFYQYAVNRQSGDYGVFQLNEKWQKKNVEQWSCDQGQCRDFRDVAFDVYAATKYALKLYSEQGLNPWVCAK